MDAFHAGVAELVDALDLGSSDESCGGSSPSARTKRSSRRLHDEYWRARFPVREQGQPNHRRRLQGYASNILNLPGLSGPAQAEED
jgi:hypothetical protein